jgi:uncharacterized membrane protein
MRPQTRITAALFAAIPVAILTAASLCAYAIAQGASWGFRLPFRAICHGMPERSFELFGAAMPVCARCTAIYAGMFVAVAAFVAIAPLRRWSFPAALALLCVAPMVVDGVTQASGLRESTNMLRAITGGLAAIGPMLWIMGRIEHPRESAPTFSES